MKDFGYPLLFEPILMERIWGGDKLKTLLKKKGGDGIYGESWEISNVEGNSSVVANGILKGKSLNELLAASPELILGKKVYGNFGKEFPLLIKFIDARTALSVQLHPNDALAKERHNSFGKTEMWYIMQAEEDANINVGFKKTISKEEYLQHLEAGKITELLNFEKVEKGDSVFINTGKVHAIGAGVLLAEIQQTSDITYRIYDWGRTDAAGNARELHTELALDAIDFEKKDDYQRPYEKQVNQVSNIAHCEYFTTNFLPVVGRVDRNYEDLDSFVIYMCVGGRASVEVDGNTETISMGETVLIPGINKKVTITAEDAELLEVYIG